MVSSVVLIAAFVLLVLDNKDLALLISIYLGYRWGLGLVRPRTSLALSIGCSCFDVSARILDWPGLLGTEGYS